MINVDSTVIEKKRAYYQAYIAAVALPKRLHPSDEVDEELQLEDRVKRSIKD